MTHTKTMQTRDVLSAYSLSRIAHIASRGIGLSLFSNGSGGWVQDATLAREVLKDFGFNDEEIFDLSRRYRGYEP